MFEGAVVHVYGEPLHPEYWQVTRRTVAGLLMAPCRSRIAGDITFQQFLVQRDNVGIERDSREGVHARSLRRDRSVVVLDPFVEAQLLKRWGDRRLSALRDLLVKAAQLLSHQGRVTVVLRQARQRLPSIRVNTSLTEYVVHYLNHRIGKLCLTERERAYLEECVQVARTHDALMKDAPELHSFGI